MSEPEDRR